MVADQIAHPAHLNARDTTLALVSRAPQAHLERRRARTGWDVPRYTLTDDFDDECDEPVPGEAAWQEQVERGVAAMEKS